MLFCYRLQYMQKTEQKKQIFIIQLLEIAIAWGLKENLPEELIQQI